MSSWSNSKHIQLKHVVSHVATHGEINETLPYIGLEDIEGHTGRLVNNTQDFALSPSRIAGEPLSGMSFCARDVLFGKLRPYLGKAWVAEFDGVCTTEALVLRPHSIEPRFLRSILLSWPILESINATTFGSKMPRADWKFIGSLHVPVLSIEQQCEIADYLDHGTAALESAITEQERLLELLAEKRRVLTANAVIRGLDPDVPLRDFGIPWIGSMPAHWKTEKARWLFRERDERSVSGEEELLTVSHLTGVTPRSDKDVDMFEAKTNEGYKICIKNDLVINTLWAWMGAMGTAPVDGIVSPAYHVYEIGDKLEPSYVDMLVRLPIFAQEVTRHSKGVWSSRLRLYPEGLFEVSLPVPPVEEQQEIVSTTAAQTNALTELEETVRHTISLLTERRASLISAAVTGQIEVGEASLEQIDLASRYS